MRGHPANRLWPQLDPDAPPVPKGLQPRPGVEYGCGEKSCRLCYAVIPPYHLRPADLEKWSTTK